MRGIVSILTIVKDFVIEHITVVVPTVAGLGFAGAAAGVMLSSATPDVSKQVESPIHPVVHAVISDGTSLAEGSNLISFSSDSVEKDITVYFTLPDSDQLITGQQFEIKMVNPKDCTSVFNSATTLANANSLVESEGTQEAIEARDGALASYVSAVNQVVGDTYTDDDRDGKIYADNIPGGDYVICFVPNGDIAATEYTQQVSIKEHVEYQVVKNIAKKVVSYDAAQDVKQEAAVVEAVITDTVKFIQSSAVGGATKLTSAALTSGGFGVSTSVNLVQKAIKAVEVTYDWASYMSGVTAGSDLTGSSGYDSGSHSATGGSATIGSGTTGITINKLVKSDDKSVVLYDIYDGTTHVYTTTDPASYVSTPSANSIWARPCATISPENGYLAALSIPQYVTLFSGAAGYNSATVEIGKSGNMTIESVTSSDTNVASVSNSGDTVVITAVGTVDGSATVTVKGVLNDGNTFSDDTNYITTTCTVSVLGSNTALKDANGSTLYLDEAGTTVATAENYKEGDAFYVVTGDRKYTGWQTIDGKTYYYDENNKPVTGQQVIQGVVYNFSDDGVLQVSGFGIDVSKWNGTIDWNQVSTAASFAIIRCGGRYQQSGGLYEDPTFYTNMKGAKAAGVQVGVYFFSTALTEAEAVEEASLAIKMAQNAGGCGLPIYIDMEDKVRGQDKLSNEQRTAIVNAFCQTVQNEGYTAGFYASKAWMSSLMNMGDIPGSVKIWVAQYNTACSYTGRYNMWQYTSKGSVPGIQGNVDCNRAY